jgi:hypothetical protein
MDMQPTLFTPAKEERLQRAYDIILHAAECGAICPTNDKLADMLGLSRADKASGYVSLLEAMGFITVQRGRKNRVVTIVKTGKKTAGIANYRPSSAWPEDFDAILMDGIAEGVGFTAVGKMLGKTKNACISRFNKIRKDMGWQAA